MANNFNDAAINAVYDKVVSHALALGRFESVNGHEPKNAPGLGITAAVWVQDIKPYRLSGLNATSGVLNLQVRVYTSFVQQPLDAIDPNVLASVTDLIAAYSGDFALGGDLGVRMVDLLGASGSSLSAVAGYVEIDRKIYRVMTITVPIIINDMWTQGGG